MYKGVIMQLGVFVAICAILGALMQIGGENGGFGNYPFWAACGFIFAAPLIYFVSIFPKAKIDVD